jgi:hypothetical protein
MRALIIAPPTALKLKPACCDRDDVPLPAIFLLRNIFDL